MKKIYSLLLATIMLFGAAATVMASDTQQDVELVYTSERAIELGLDQEAIDTLIAEENQFEQALMARNTTTTKYKTVYITFNGTQVGYISYKYVINYAPVADEWYFTVYDASVVGSNGYSRTYSTRYVGGSRVSTFYVDYTFTKGSSRVSGTSHMALDKYTGKVTFK